ncbi:MAG: hypothetical protein J6S67_25680 [Methanobrevibacter sp.]|nr:hypothetical protein [Methanobrevibacter sp.]
MKKYLVKLTYTQQKDCPYYKGEVQEWLYGKGCETVIDTPYYINKYGYKTKGQARKSWAFRCKQDERYWKIDKEIVEYEI